MFIVWQFSIIIVTVLYHVYYSILLLILSCTSVIMKTWKAIERALAELEIEIAMANRQEKPYGMGKI